jgi:hypothetical protein
MNMLNMVIALCCRFCPRGVGQHLGWVGSTLRLRYESQLLGGSQAFQQAGRQQAPHSLVVCSAGRAVDVAVWEPTSTSIRVPAIGGGSQAFLQAARLSAGAALRCVVGLLVDRASATMADAASIPTDEPGAASAPGHHERQHHVAGDAHSGGAERAC